MNKILALLSGELPPEPFLLEPAVTATNIVNFVEWYKTMGGRAQDLALPFHYSELESGRSDRWLDYKQHLAFQKSIIDRVDRFTLKSYYDMGYAGIRNRMIAPYKAIVALLPRNQLLPLLLRVSKTFQSYTTISIMQASDGYWRFRYDVDARFNEYMLGGLPHNITGFLCISLAFKNGVEPEYRIVRSQNKLENVILAAYERYGLSYTEDESFVFVDGRRLGRKLPPDETGMSPGVEILEDLLKGDLVLLEKGVVFDAPYCEVEIFWKRKMPLFKRLVMGGKRLGSRTVIAQELEERILAAQQNYLEAVAAKEKALRLSEELDEKNRSLEELVQSLERKVGERTAHLNASLDRLKEMDVLKSNLLATLSHELRTPLALIKTPLDRVQRGEMGNSIDTDDSMFMDISRQVDRLIGTLDGILDFTMLEFDRSTLSLIPYPIGKLITEICTDISKSVTEAGLCLQVEPLPEFPVVVECVPQLLKTAVANIISNAVKYTPYGGSVKVSLSIADGFALISVQDTGVGIDEKDRFLIFNQFYRSTDVIERGIPGRGIGLSLTQAIVELHDGTITCSSVPDAGSEFTLRVPLSDKPTKTSPNPSTAPGDLFIRKNSRAKRRIPKDTTFRAARLLYVEDNNELAELVRSCIEPKHTVHLAPDGETALRLLQSNTYDLVISDVMMPGIDGVELLHRSNQVLTTKVPFLFLTAKADDDSKMDALDEGALDYMKKPFDELELRRKIDNIIAFKDGLMARSSLLSTEEADLAARSALIADGLTTREVEVALLLGQGYSRKEIANRLGIALATTKRHVENIYEKLGVQDRFQLFVDYMGNQETRL